MADRTLTGKLEFEYTGTAAEKAEKDIRDVGKAGDDAEKGLKKANKSSMNLNKMLGAVGVTLGAGIIARKLLQIGAASISAASDVAEMSSKFDVVFGQEAPRIEQGLADMASTINRSRFDLMEYAATLQDTFVPLGFARDAAADLSVEVVALSEDLASFNNLRTEDVVRDIQSALVGNTETLRKYGVVAQETQIKAKALEMGLWDGKGAVDANAKAQTILALTMEGTTDAQGDALRTADSYENVSKGLEAAVKDLSVAFGQGLIPAMTDVKKEATDVISTLARFWSASNMLRQAQEDGIITAGEYRRQQAKLTFGGDEGADVLERLTEIYEDLTIGQDRYQHSAGLTAEQIAELNAEEQEHADRLAESAERIEDNRDHYERMLAVGELRRTALQREIELSDEVEDSAIRGERAQQAYAEATKVAAEAAKEEAEVLRSEMAEAAAAAAEALDDLWSKQSNYFFSAVQAEDATVNLNEELFQLADKYDLSAEAAAALGVATGMLTPAQAQEYVQATLLRIELENLIQAYKDGKISADDVIEVSGRLAEQQGLTAESAINMWGQFQTATSELGQLEEAAEGAREELENMPREIRVKINYDVGTVPGSSSQTTILEGGEEAGQHGLDMIVPAGFPHDNFPIRASSGERVQITPAGQIGQGEGGTTQQVFNIYAAPGMSEERLAAKIAQKARMAQASGQGAVLA